MSFLEQMNADYAKRQAARKVQRQETDAKDEILDELDDIMGMGGQRSSLAGAALNVGKVVGVAAVVALCLV